MPLLSLRVFIVEDSAVILEALTVLIEEIERVAIVGAATEVGLAIEEIFRLNPDVVILDLRIAGGSGLDILKSVKSERRKSPVVIVFSGNPEDGYRRACIKLGADFVFDKSREFDQVAQVLRSLTGASQ